MLPDLEKTAHEPRPGGIIAARLPEKALRLSFAVLVLATAGFVFWKGWKTSSAASAADFHPQPSKHHNTQVRS